MGKKLKPADEPVNAAFYWTRDPEFVLPGKNGGLDTCVEQEFTVSRSNDLRTLLNAFLETAIGFIKANAGVVRVLLPDEQTLQVISAVGLSGEELEAERIVELACEDCGKSAFKHGLCSTDVNSCRTRHGDQPHRQFRSVISIPLESRNSSEAMLGVFTLFFDTPQSTSGNAATMAISFADLLGTLLEHIKSTREAKREELLRERQSIANDIHDSLAQTLNYARMNTTLLSDAIRNNNEVMATKYTRDIDEALEIGQKAVRTLITDFRSEMHPAGLLQALQSLVEKFSEHSS